MTPDLILAGLGLMVTAEAFALLLLGLVVHRQSQQVRHLGAVTRMLTKAWKESGGSDIRVDPVLLGESPDEVAPDDLPDESQTPLTWERISL